MNTNNRLQFRYHDQVFDTREEAVEYIQSQIRFTEEGLASEDPSYGFSLLAEPTVLLYKKEEDETDPHLILVIGSQTNDGTQYSDNRFCIIDIDKTEQEIADLAEELEKAIKSLTLIALSSDTLNFYADKTDEGTYVSGDVKVATSHIFDDVRKDNKLMVTPDGLFIYVNLEYNEEKEEFTFSVSNYDGTLSETTVKFPNNYVVKGYYSKRDESIHLVMKNGGEVVIDCEKLIAEWTVEGDASKTPVVLTREELEYDGTDEHHHIEPWQDVLRADVRIKDEEKILLPDGTYKYVKDENSTNILSRTSDARYLYVDGKASNIIYYKNGEKSTVKAALDELQNIKISSDNDNIIINKTDGFFASTKLSYISKQNKLVFKASGQEDTVIQLNGFKLFENIYYDPTQEALVITYIDGNDKVQIVTIPIGEMIRDWEWEPQNEGHNVKIVKKRNVAGNDKVSADAKIYNDPDNILVDKNHELFVKGTADNIKYENGTVKDAIDGLKTTDAALDNKINIEIARAEAAEETLDGKIQAVDDKIGEGFGPRNTVRDEIDNLQSEIEAVSADSASSIKDVINIDESINVDKTDPVRPVISVNLSEEVEHDKPNIIKLNADGIYAGVDLAYEETANKLIFSTTNGSKEIQLESMSSIISIEYNPTKEAIVITYMTNGHEIKTVEIPVGDLINEWRVEDGHPHAVALEKVRVASGTSEQDVLKASVIINDDHDDNILVMDDGALYVPGADIEQNKQDIADLKERMTTAEGDIDNLEAALALEAERRISGDTQLTERITTEEARARETENRIDAALQQEIARATAKENELNTAIVNETLRAQAADSELYQKIADESADRTAKDAELESLIAQETQRAENAEENITHLIEDEAERRLSGDTQLNNKITTEEARARETETRIETALNNEIARAQSKEGELNTAITNETIRANAADNELYQKIADETAERISKDAELESIIAQEASRAQVAETTISERLASEVTRSTDEDERLTAALQQEITDRQQGDAALEEEIRASKLTFEDTSSIDFNNPYVENNVVKADVKLQAGDNIIKLGSGLYATATLEYEPTGNKLRLVTSNGAQEYIQLVGATLLDSIEYDSVNKLLIIKYTDGTGSPRETSVGVTDLWNELIVQNPSEKSAVELTKTIGDPGNPDTLSGRVLITDDRDGDGKPDAGSPNIVEIRNNGLFVDGSALSAASGTAECVKNELKVFETAVIGHIISQECGSGYTYEPNNMATYINTATSFNNADFILDQNIKRVENDVQIVSAKTDCVDEKTDAIYELMYGAGSTLPQCGEGASYQPYVGACIISGATSFNEADHMLNDAICQILTMWTSGKTCSTESLWVEDGANRKIEVHARLSRGNTGQMTDDDVMIETLNGDYIDPTGTEFTDTNALRIVCLTEGPSGTTPSIDSMQNGIYLSNAWDCGLYYSPSDTEAKAKAEAAGYNTNYSTDESPSASNFDYMNNVR